MVIHIIHVVYFEIYRVQNDFKTVLQNVYTCVALIRIFIIKISLILIFRCASFRYEVLQMSCKKI